MIKKKSKNLIIILAVIIVIGIIAYFLFIPKNDNSPNSPVNSNYLIYENSEYTLEYPSDWTKQEFTEGIMIFYAPSKEDIFNENLNAMIQNLPQPMTLPEYTELSINQIGQLIENSEIIESTSTTLNGNEAYKIVYSGKMGSIYLKWMQVWTIKNNKAYILSYTAEIDKYSEYLDTIQTIINSFEII